MDYKLYNAMVILIVIADYKYWYTYTEQIMEALQLHRMQTISPEMQLLMYLDSLAGLHRLPQLYISVCVIL